MVNIESEYLLACKSILDKKQYVKDRTGVGTFMETNVVLEHSDTSYWFPAFITKKIAWRVLIGELLWFLEGSTSDRRLAEITFGDGDRKTIWTANWEAKPYRRPMMSSAASTDFNGPRLLGPVYGQQWRFWGEPNRRYREDESKEVDQIRSVIQGITNDPYGRRHLVSAWNPSDLKQQSLPPCHYSFQFNVFGGKLDILVNMRSGDMFLGVPFNIASYATLQHIIARETGYKPGKLTLVIGNAHIYSNHIDQMEEQISRYDVLNSCKIPFLTIREGKLFGEKHGNVLYNTGDFVLHNYEPMPVIKGAMAV